MSVLPNHQTLSGGPFKAQSRRVVSGNIFLQILNVCTLIVLLFQLNSLNTMSVLPNKKKSSLKKCGFGSNFHPNA